jgi:hypothetical protein
MFNIDPNSSFKPFFFRCSSSKVESNNDANKLDIRENNLFLANFICIG